MRNISIGLALAIGILPICLKAQAIRGPILGYVADDAGASVRPVLGVPGASSLGGRLPLDAGLRQAQISPGQDYLLAQRREDDAVVLFDLAASDMPARPLLFPGVAEVLSISPSGSAAAIYDAAARQVYTISGLPRNPGPVRTFDGAEVSGRVVALVVSDDGALALVRSETEDIDQVRTEFLVLGDAGVSWRVPTEDAAVAFVPGRRDIVVADNLTKSAFLVTDIGGSYGRLPLLTLADDTERFSAAAMSADGARAFAVTQSGTVAIMEMGTGQVTWLSCQCRPTTLQPLRGPSLFRLTDASATEPIVVLDASDDPRFVLTPPNTEQ